MQRLLPASFKVDHVDTHKTLPRSFHCFELTFAWRSLAIYRNAGPIILLQCWLVPLLQPSMPKVRILSSSYSVSQLLRLFIFRICALDGIVGGFYSLDRIGCQSSVMEIQVVSRGTCKKAKPTLLMSLPPLLCFVSPVMPPK